MGRVLKNMQGFHKKRIFFYFDRFFTLTEFLFFGLNAYVLLILVSIYCQILVGQKKLVAVILITRMED